ncbi:MAG TPA: NAD(P)/FAD-dependent oxidoreductase [Gemmatimonadales bacterium]|jgi:NADH dehydrogenase
MARIVIIGGGFGGFYTALGLEKQLSRQRHELILVSNENYLLYTPLLPEAASGALEPRHLVVPLRTALKWTRIIIASVTDVDIAGRSITICPADGAPRPLPYDQLVFALGSTTRMPAAVPGLAERAIGFKTLAEAIALRNRLLGNLEIADATGDDALRRRLLTFVFVGGGYAGTETAAEIQSTALDALRYYPRLEPAMVRVVLLEAAPMILRDLGDDFATQVQQGLIEKGIEIRVATTLKEVREGVVILASGEPIPTETVVWTAGVVAHPLARKLGAVDNKGRVITTPAMRIAGHDEIWALGDSAAVPDAKTGGESAPPTAQHVLRQARTLSRNITAALEGGHLRPFSHGNLGMLAGLGEHDGAGRLLGIPVRGFFAWWIVRTYHLLQLPTMSRKIRVVLDWTIALFFRRDIAQLGSLQGTTAFARGAMAGSRPMAVGRTQPAASGQPPADSGQLPAASGRP